MIYNYISNKSETFKIQIMSKVLQSKWNPVIDYKLLWKEFNQVRAKSIIFVSETVEGVFSIL